MYKTKTELLNLRKELYDFGLYVFLGNHSTGDASLDSLLSQVFTYTRTEINRQANVEQPSDLEKHFLKADLAYLVGKILATRLLTKRARLLEHGFNVSFSEWLVASRLLSEAIRVLRTGLLEMYKSQIPKPDLSNLPSQLWFNFYDLTADDARATAAEIDAEFKAALSRVTVAHAKRIGSVNPQATEGA